MFRDLFINSTILISFVFIGSHIFKEDDLSNNSSITTKALTGIGGGLLGITLILFGVKIEILSTIIDLRYLAIIILIRYVGLLPSVIAAVIMITFRITYFGITKASIFAVISMILTVIGCNIIWRIKEKQFWKWIFMNMYSVVVMSSCMYVLLRNSGKTFVVITSYAAVSMGIGITLYYLLNYVDTVNIHYRKFKEEAKRDYLTGLNNLRQFEYSMNELIYGITTNNEKLSVLIIDVDHFKQVNDTYGHLAGDIVLKEIGKVLLNNCRENDIISRIGGEEFTILLPYCPHKQALEVAERVRSEVQVHQFILPNNTVLSITVSIGVSTYPETVMDPAELIHKADEGLYLAKRSGRNMVCSIQ
ncbi:diguanylate cyclase [Anaerosolibacter carboniphilus]|uniref:Diguanylate cyclase n=1 Tax=Anaerosolibacter carboniphilus TaxID=1417629 RepID=A0A841KXZ1_9FIRM|nr:GGDEF domain-containing protein [Anaerosolibacter carboniphilus]MBB6215005.1 diguanylate cyclase [Anaerosolibacter carboniphilus]